MMHPNTELRFIDHAKGLGVFATEFLPKGTIVYVKDELEITISRSDKLSEDPRYSKIIQKYSYVDAYGNYILSWDQARFVNHCCQANSLTTGYGFEVAVEDINAGEEITDDYGLLNIEENICLSCEKAPCRKWARSSDFELYTEEWDQKVIFALERLEDLKQPLWEYMDEKSQKQVKAYLSGKAPYLSVQSQKYSQILSKPNTGPSLQALE